MNKVKAVVFITIFCLLFSLVQAVMIPNWRYPYDTNHHTSKTREYMSLEEDSVQVLFFGTSHVLFGINPMQLYSEKKIRSVNMAISASRIAQGYYYLKNALKFQKPDLLILDVSTLYLNSYNGAGWKLSLDSGFPYDLDRIEASAEYARETIAQENRLAENPDTGYESDNSETEGEQSNLIAEQSDRENELPGSGSERSERTSVTHKETGSPVDVKGMISEANRLFNAEICGLLPMYTYHYRWASLNLADFEIFEYSPYYGKGYITSTLKGWAGSTLESVNKIANDMKAEQTYAEWRVVDQEESIEFRKTNLYSEKPEDEQLKWLYKLNDLCDKNGVELRLVKVPVISTYKEYESSWTKLRSQCIREIANELGIKFCDMVYDVDLKLKPTDFIDSGKHLNYYGAKKTTTCLGNYIEEVCGIKGATNPQYEKTLSAYKKIDSVAELQNISDWEEYFSFLSRHLTGKTIFLAVNGVKNAQFTKEEIESLRAINVMSKAVQRFGETAYVGVIRDGKSVYEAISELPVETTYTINKNNEAVLESYGSANTSNHIGAASILINGTESALNGRGINIVVYDNNTNCIVDQLNFYKTAPDSVISCERNTSKLDNYMRVYEVELYKLYETYFEN